jgi:hypothetical protein
MRFIRQSDFGVSLLAAFARVLCVLCDKRLLTAKEAKKLAKNAQKTPGKVFA